jgi:hypothetical protein
MSQLTGHFLNTSHSAEAYVEEQEEQEQEQEQEDQEQLLPLDEVIADILNTIPGDGFIPSMEQVFALETSITNGVISPGTLSSLEWHNALWAHNGGVLFRNLHNAQDIFEDQMVRAIALVVKMMSRHIKIVYIMDGHGRFLMFDSRSDRSRTRPNCV